MATPFIYTNPAAGQQAVQYAQMQQTRDLEREAGIDDMYMNTARQATAQMGTMGNLALSRSEMDRAAANDAERKRQFDLSLQLDKDRLSAATKSDADRAAAIQQAKDAEYDRQAEMWEQRAEALNANPPRPGERIPNGIILDPVTKRYVSLMKRRPQTINAPTAGQQMDTIDSIRQRARSLAFPNSAPVGGAASTVVRPIQSPGLRAPSPTDFRVPVQYPGGPLIREAAGGIQYPTDSRELDRMVVFPQREVIDMLDYEESVRQPRPLSYIAPDPYLQTDILPYRR